MDAGTVRGLVAGARRIVVLTGAGISTDSGIPDYRGPNGLWTRNPEAARMSTLADYVADPEVRRRAWQSRRTHPAWTATPNDAHRALVVLERSGRLVALLTQNVDGLHQRAGSDPDLVVELHGTIWWAECLGCGARTAMADELARVADGDPDPACTACGGILKSATISFGQPLDRAVIERAVEAASSCDLFLAVGSSLTVQPAAGLCQVAVDAGADLVIVNAEPTPYDAIARAVVRGPIGEVLPAVVAGQAATGR
ncbi:MAG: NAD-dependent deacetylase [Frankiaceae bacterium]|nr:NAD-dependent deacetylase [Frankiaceae bacterium]MBV9369044.1 NAD-dependent deacetylase [Frankiales bacterium]